MKIANFYNIPIGNAKKLVSKFFDKEKYVPSYENLLLYLRLGLKLKKYIVSLNSVNHNDQHNALIYKKDGDKDGKAWYKLINNVTTDKTT